MTSDVIKCPCCGQKTAPGQVRVSLDENRLWFGEVTVVLPPRLAELAFILAKNMPCSVGNEQIAQAMWGGLERFSDNNIKVAVCQLRPRLKAVGLSVATTHNRGYRMSRMSRTERSQTGVEHRAQA